MIEAPHHMLVPLIQQAMRQRGFYEAAKDFAWRCEDYGTTHFSIIMRLWRVS